MYAPTTPQVPSKMAYPHSLAPESASGGASACWTTLATGPALASSSRIPPLLASPSSTHASPATAAREPSNRGDSHSSGRVGGARQAGASAGVSAVEAEAWEMHGLQGRMQGSASSSVSALASASACVSALTSTSSSVSAWGEQRSSQGIMRSGDAPTETASEPRVTQGAEEEASATGSAQAAGEEAATWAPERTYSSSAAVAAAGLLAAGGVSAPHPPALVRSAVLTSDQGSCVASGHAAAVGVLSGALGRMPPGVYPGVEGLGDADAAL